jgi:hypothetical protein
VSVIGAVRFEGWTPIATRPRGSRNVHCKLFWTDIIDAPISSDQARVLAKQGRLLIATRHHPDHIEMVVRSPARTPADRNKPADKPASDTAEAFRLAARRVPS